MPVTPEFAAFVFTSLAVGLYFKVVDGARLRMTQVMGVEYTEDKSPTGEESNPTLLKVDDLD